MSSPPTDEAPAPERVPRPWWIPAFLGRIPIGLSSHHVALVGVVSFAALFENYDISMLSAALKQIRESFGLGQAEMSSLLAWVRIGAIPAFFILPLADRFGRRRVFLIAILGMSIGTVISAFAQTPIQFIAAQTLTRPFIVASIVTAVVIIAEELPAEHRGWGVGMLGAIGSFGFGLGALLYAFVEYVPFGWRSLYLVGGAPLLLFGFFRRTIPETRRFTEHQQQAGADGYEGRLSIIGAALTPLVELFRQYPARAFAVMMMALIFAMGSSPAFGLLSDFVQTEHGWQPSGYSLVILISGLAGAIGNPLMGWAADRLGRRPVASAAFGLLPLTVFGIYYGPGWAIPLLSVPFLFFLTGGNVIMRIVASELFPTSTRNSAMGLETVNETIGAAFGYAAVGGLALSAGGAFGGGALGTDGASMGPPIFFVSLVTLLGLFVFWRLPETAGRELEETSQRTSVDEAQV
ncbi:MAG: MFS transporter [Myxococcota bacterium]